eukprot:CAMPEP_0185829362 /NCGR_PEP_ID=MMETSP1353-20130828/207_1 /TAXON_ID=1077150 /ORGANISM="Erythrolobus australicus, Strain CCMP3124" /LENGTH=230 /DNA_ID=CAMNT_0028527145 /DNA_START=154 /DNA_END=846 /DNA_ORIENTATION=+
MEIKLSSAEVELRECMRVVGGRGTKRLFEDFIARRGIMVMEEAKGKQNKTDELVRAVHRRSAAGASTTECAPRGAIAKVVGAAEKAALTRAAQNEALFSRNGQSSSDTRRYIVKQQSTQTCIVPIAAVGATGRDADKYMCIECGARFAKQRLALAHVAALHSETRSRVAEKSERDEVTTAREQNFSVDAAAAGSQAYSCAFCAFTLRTESGLRFHQKLAHNANRLPLNRD